MNNPQDVLGRLTTGEFNALIGVAESVWLDAKECPYVLDTMKQKLEIAKDVSALANAVGGIIVLGFDTTRDPLTSGEHISEVRPFPISMVDPGRYRKIVHEYVYPPLDIVVRVFEGADVWLAGGAVHEDSRDSLAAARRASATSQRFSGRAGSV